MTTLSTMTLPGTLEALLVDTARSYLTRAHRLDPESAEAIARQAARATMAGLDPAALTQARPVVIGAARRLVQALPEPPQPGERAPWPTAGGRPMRVQPLDPLTLADLGDRSRRGGRRVLDRLPAAHAVAMGITVFVITLLAVPSPPG